MSFINKYTVYYTIDIEENLAEVNSDSTFQSHMLTFVENELGSLYSSDANREYAKRNNTTQVVNLLNQLIIESDADEKKELTDTIADRLLREEIAVQSRISQLLKDVQRGGLIISHFDYENEEYIAIIKVHYIDFYEESTFQESRGLPKKDVILKTSITKVIQNKTDNLFLLSDSTKSKGAGSAKFWWDDFLELDVIKSDKENTKESFDQIEGVLKREFYNLNREDYWTLKNNLIAYYRLVEQFTMSEMINSTLGDFNLKSLEGKSSDEKEDIKLDLKNKFESTILNTKGDRRFDTQFVIDKKEVTARAKTKITLMENVDLNILGEVEDFHGKIIPDKDGHKKYIKIYSDEGYDRFKN